jgi:hypothetical protein
MLLVLGSFVMVCTAFGTLGLIVLACVPSLRVTFLNLLLFVIGAFFGALAFLLAYLEIFKGHELKDAAFVGLFLVFFLGATLGGALLVKLKIRFLKTERTTTSQSALSPVSCKTIKRSEHLGTEADRGLDSHN